jgi:hypothetical protein
MKINSLVRISIVSLVATIGATFALAQIPCAATLLGNCPPTACDSLPSSRTCTFVSQCNIQACMPVDCVANGEKESFQNAIRTNWNCTYRSQGRGNPYVTEPCFGGVNQPGSVEADCCRCPALVPE